MRRLALAAVVVLIALAGTLTATAAQTNAPTTARSIQAPNPPPPPPTCLAQSFATFSGRVWAPKLWHRGAPPKATIAAAHHRIGCAPSAGHRKAMKATWRRDRGDYFAHRHAEQERIRYTPYSCATGRSAIPCSIMECESGGSYTAKNPTSSAGGKYQILDTTWRDYGGAHYSGTHPAAEAPPAEQDRIAAEIWADSGGGAWVCS